MNALRALILGWEKAKRRKRAVALYWAFHTLIALVAAVPLAGIGITQAARTRYGDELLRDFDLMFVLEAAYRVGPLDWAVFILVPLLMLLHVGVVYLNGGALHVLRRDNEAYSPALFWGGAGLYFWRFLRVSLYSVLAWVPLFVVNGAIRKGAGKIWGEGMVGGPVFVATQVRIALLVLLAGYAVSVVDYARARLAAENSRRAFKQLIAAMVFVARRPWLAMGPWAALAILFGAVSALYLKVANFVPVTVMPAAILMIVLQQAFILMRISLRFIGWGAVIEIDAAARGEGHEPEQEVFSHVHGGDGSLRAGAEADPEAESPAAG
ncbi:MAG: hypothetical protein HXY18_09905 [Bryobacteraceae bacterium]|nr:hypothetical protein [Bryobacteraceae bacterium]